MRNNQRVVRKRRNFYLDVHWKSFNQDSLFASKNTLINIEFLFCPGGTFVELFVDSGHLFLVISPLLLTFCLGKKVGMDSIGLVV